MTTTLPSPAGDNPLARAIDSYRSGSWAEALRAFEEQQALAPLAPELEELRDDIRLKQRFDERMGAIVAPKAPRRNRLPAGAPVVAGALTALLALGAGIAAVLALPGAEPTALAPQPASIIGALPTPAPTATPQPTAVPPTGTLSVAPAAGGPLTRAADNIFLIFDASGSMLAPLGERPKIDIAQQAVGELVGVLPDEARVALRTYGRNRPDDCADVELVSPLAPLDRAALAAQVAGIVPVNYGRTPIASSLAQIPADLAGADGDTLVLLLSDGEESCEGDPAAVAAELHAANPRLRVSVIGFAVDAAQQEQLAAVARAGGGSFFAADDVAQLAGALRQAVVPVFRVLDEGGAELARADLGEPISLPPGRYRLEVGEIAPLVVDGVTVRGGQETLVEVRDEAGELRAEVREGN